MDDDAWSMIGLTREDQERIPVNTIMDIRERDQTDEDAALARHLHAAQVAEAAQQQQQQASSASHNYGNNYDNNDNWSDSDGWDPLLLPHAQPGPAPVAAAAAASSGGGGGGWTSGGVSRPSGSGQQHLQGRWGRWGRSCRSNKTIQIRGPSGRIRHVVRYGVSIDELRQEVLKLLRLDDSSVTVQLLVRGSSIRDVDALRDGDEVAFTPLPLSPHRTTPAPSAAPSANSDRQAPTTAPNGRAPELPRPGTTATDVSQWKKRPTDTGFGDIFVEEGELNGQLFLKLKIPLSRYNKNASVREPVLIHKLLSETVRQSSLESSVAKQLGEFEQDGYHVVVLERPPMPLRDFFREHIEHVGVAESVVFWFVGDLLRLPCRSVSEGMTLAQFHQQQRKFFHLPSDTLVRVFDTEWREVVDLDDLDDEETVQLSVELPDDVEAPHNDPTPSPPDSIPTPYSQPHGQGATPTRASTPARTRGAATSGAAAAGSDVGEGAEGAEGSEEGGGVGEGGEGGVGDKSVGGGEFAAVDVLWHLDGSQSTAFARLMELPVKSKEGHELVALLIPHSQYTMEVKRAADIHDWASQQQLPAVCKVVHRRTMRSPSRNPSCRCGWPEQAVASFLRDIACLLVKLHKEGVSHAGLSIRSIGLSPVCCADGARTAFRLKAFVYKWDNAIRGRTRMQPSRSFYVAPEVLQGRHCGTATDIFALDHRCLHFILWRHILSFRRLPNRRLRLRLQAHGHMRGKTETNYIFFVTSPVIRGSSRKDSDDDDADNNEYDGCGSRDTQADHGSHPVPSPSPSNEAPTCDVEFIPPTTSPATPPSPSPRDRSPSPVPSQSPSLASTITPRHRTPSGELLLRSDTSQPSPPTNTSSPSSTSSTSSTTDGSAKEAYSSPRLHWRSLP
ncbi:unnamed protein product [Vitrella brassicaformis CCMP3155]|uniref:Protein kinase domain-containing protein n=1 Tax=Vitrella brassicaformis (strain CCMP3155) TaxID=1169540 RepID=A0A0G4EJC1_VITBC|nr:unnamed protein product [Vitrella brassicaformis CCMP3155]|eukprot:CEL96839.1 unnamed protein product [Vitrella brassicaformis CCMP3155]